MFSQRFTLDGVTPSQFDDLYPDGFLLGYVSLTEFDAVLHHYSRRGDGELWEVGNASSLSYLIAYLSEGRPISPPLVKPVIDGEVILQGGHHRYAVAKEIGVDTFPIHVNRSDKSEIDKRVTVNWAV